MRLCAVCLRTIAHPTDAFCRPVCGRIYLGIVLDCPQERALSSMGKRWSGATGIRPGKLGGPAGAAEAFRETFGTVFDDMTTVGES